MTKHLKQVGFLLLLLMALLATSTAWSEDVCRSYSFQGMSANKQRAESLLPKSTSQQDKISIYIEYTSEGELYYHSNYITPGYEFPTKVRGNPIEQPVFADPQQIFLNILYDEMPSEVAAVNAQKLFREKTEIILDVSIFDSNGIPRIDLSGAKQIRIVDGHKAVRLSSGGEVLTTLKPPPSLIARIKGCCFFGRPPHRAGEYGEALSKKLFEPSTVKIASLFIDSATEAAFAQSKTLKAKRLAGDGKTVRSNDEMEKLFVSARGKTLVLLGHVEGSDYVIRDSANKEQFRTSIEFVRQLAKRESVSLIDIGCETTKAIQAESLGIGIATKYNSVDAVRSISRAMETSKNYEEFMSNISSKGLKIVVDESFVRDHIHTTHTTVYSSLKSSAKDAWVRVAQITFSLIGKQG